MTALRSSRRPAARPVASPAPATAYDRARVTLAREPRTWLVTGAAGFVGSNLVEALLALDQVVVGLDNFSTGRPDNLHDVERCVGSGAWQRFRFVEGDVRDLGSCREACRGADVVLHQAALGSVPRSIEDPVATNESNVSGTLNMLVAARDAGVQRFVYAASSAAYGDHPALPKIEPRIGRPLSPYAVTKQVNELYAGVIQRTYGLETVGLRYFNVFGRRQDPAGPYAAVIPKWLAALLEGEPCTIYGDGESSRDFCYVDDVIQANVLAATVADPAATDQVYNVAYGRRTTLNRLFRMIRHLVAGYHPAAAGARPVHEDFRPGDVRHSRADVSRARERLGYAPAFDIARGLRLTLGWYVARHGVERRFGRTAEPHRVPSSTN